MGDVKMVVVDGVRYRPEDTPTKKSDVDTKAKGASNKARSAPNKEG